MDPSADLDELMNQFRLASRELFNHFFRVPDPYSRSRTQDAWLREERFGEVQIVLFRKLVAEQVSIHIAEYGNAQPHMLVAPRHDTEIRIMLNREVDAGYWDYPVTAVDKHARMRFVSFFDWDQLEIRDNRFVRVLVERWPTHSNAVGKHGLVESQVVRFIED